MKVLDFVKEAKAEALLCENHPAKELEYVQKQQYLNGIALISNADDKISDSVKEYLSILLISFGHPKEKINDLIAFAQNPDKAVWLEIIEYLKTTEIKYTFMLDCLFLANKDKKYSENEKELIDYYFEVLKFNYVEKTQILEIFNALNKYDPKAIYKILHMNLVIPKNSYWFLFEFFKIDVNKINKDILDEVKDEIQFETIKIEAYTRMSNIWNLTPEQASKFILYVTKLPISNKLFIYFLQMLNDIQKIKITNEGLVYDLLGNTMIDLKLSDITYADGIFICDKNDMITGVSLKGALNFIEWLNSISEKKWKTPEIKGSQLTLRPSNIRFYNEIFWCKEDNMYIEISEQSRFGEFITFKITAVDENKPIEGMTFRLEPDEKNPVKKIKFPAKEQIKIRSFLWKTKMI